MLFDVIDRCDLYAVSQSVLASGESYTFAQGHYRTTVDYCMIDPGYAHLIDSCTTLSPAALNFSDHLPISISLNITMGQMSETDVSKRLNWQLAIEKETVKDYSVGVSVFLSEVLTRPVPLDDKSLDREIAEVSHFLCSAAQEMIPVIREKKKKSFYRNEDLKQKSKENKAAWRLWVDAGRPREGRVYDSMKAAKYDVKQCLKLCKAKDERKRIQSRDIMVKTSDPGRFRLPKKRQSGCNKLCVDGEVYKDQNSLLQCWRNHFSMLGETAGSNNDLQNVVDSNLLYESSKANEDSVLDQDITLEEIDYAVKSMQNGKSSGPDNVSVEHLKYGGPGISRWLKRVFNAIVTLEVIPSVLNRSIVVPVYKGKGRDPTIPGSYRGISLTSVIGKCLEKVILSRLVPVLEDNGCLHPSQTAYFKGRSCLDGIFATNEVLTKLMSDGDSPYLCLFDLEKAFDSVEYNVLLHHLYASGINGKTWRLIRSWYDDPVCAVRLNGSVSASFTVSRGVKQGAVLSPILFNLVMNQILYGLSKDDTSLSLIGVNAGCGAHADDIRTCTIGAVGVERQAAFLQSLTSENSLRLNMTKTEIVHLARHPVPTENVNINNTQIETKKEAKCLGVWWTQDLSSRKSVEENISKARRAFFALGAIDIFQGACNPLTALSLFNTFVLPILLYGCEIWSLNDPLLEKLESFQGEIGKRILSLPKYYNNLSVKIALKWPSFRVLVLIRKLSYLAKLLSQELTSTHVRLFHSLASANALDIALVRQCKELEISYGTQFWETSINSPEEATEIVKKAKDELLERDWDSTVHCARSHSSLLQVGDKVIVNEWRGVWDEALNHGSKGTKLSQNLFKVLCRPLFGDRSCKLCSVSISESSYANHIYTVHDFPLARIIQSIREDKSELFTNPALSCINFN